MKLAAALLFASLASCFAVAWMAATRPPACPLTVSVATFGPPKALEQGQLITVACKDGHWHLTSGPNADLVR